MAITFDNVTATEESISLTAIGDGATNTLSLVLTEAPFNLPFTASSGFPVSVSGPGSVVVFGSDDYNASWTLTPATFTLKGTFTPQGSNPTNPPNASTGPISLTFVY